MAIRYEGSLDESPFAPLLFELDGSALIALSGELDVSNAGETREHFVRSDVRNAPVVNVDLSEVTFIDSATIGVFISACERIRASEGVFSVRCDAGHVRSTLEAAGLVDYFNTQDAFQTPSEFEDDQTRCTDKPSRVREGPR